MNKKSQILLLFITISFFSCNSADKIVPISDMNTDFPISEKLEFNPFNKYDIPKGSYFIEDSILWHSGESVSSFGSCYNLNTGAKLSTIIMKGKASYEFTDLPGSQYVGDSIQFYMHEHFLKTFSKKDIIENKPMGERGFSVVTIPDSICAYRVIKLPNGSVLATIRPTYEGYDRGRKNEINEKSIVIFNNNEAKAYEVIKYDSFDVEQLESIGDGEPAKVNDQIKMSYTNGEVDIKGNDFAVFSVYGQFMLYVLDINNGNAVKEKRYTKMQGLMNETTNEMKLVIRRIISNDKYILSHVEGFLVKKIKS